MLILLLAMLLLTAVYRQYRVSAQRRG